MESDNEIIATAEMPGLEKQDIKINVTEDMLEISAETKHKEKKKKKAIFTEKDEAGAIIVQSHSSKRLILTTQKQHMITVFWKSKCSRLRSRRKHYL